MIGEVVQATKAARALRRTRELLADVYTVKGAQIWLTHANKHLGHRAPLEMILDGFGDMVIAEAERLAAW